MLKSPEIICWFGGFWKRLGILGKWIQQKGADDQTIVFVISSWCHSCYFQQCAVTTMRDGKATALRANSVVVVPATTVTTKVAAVTARRRRDSKMCLRFAPFTSLKWTAYGLHVIHQEHTITEALHIEIPKFARRETKQSFPSIVSCVINNWFDLLQFSSSFCLRFQYTFHPILKIRLWIYE